MTNLWNEKYHKRLIQININEMTKNKLWSIFNINSERGSDARKITILTNLILQRIKSEWTFILQTINPSYRNGNIAAALLLLSIQENVYVTEHTSNKVQQWATAKSCFTLGKFAISIRNPTMYGSFTNYKVSSSTYKRSIAT